LAVIDSSSRNAIRRPGLLFYVDVARITSTGFSACRTIVSVTLPSTGYVFIKQARKSLRGHGCNFLLTIKVFPMFQV
jgi:hypothetical protein